MKDITRFIITLGATTAIAACSGAVSTDLDPSRLSLDSLATRQAASFAGSWVRLGLVPGSSERWTLSVTDTIVTGSGAWTGEACCNGSVTLHGVVSRDSVHLELEFFAAGTPSAIPRYREHVDAALQTATDLVGFVSLNGGARGAGHWQRVAPSFDGTWTRLGEVPGSSERWTIAVSDSAVTGTGTWTGEACCDGTIGVRGRVRGDSIHLDLSFFNRGAAAGDAPRFAAHMDAALVPPDDLIGTASGNGVPPVAAHWRRGTNPF